MKTLILKYLNMKKKAVPLLIFKDPNKVVEDEYMSFRFKHLTISIPENTQTPLSYSNPDHHTPFFIELSSLNNESCVLVKFL